MRDAVGDGGDGGALGVGGVVARETGREEAVRGAEGGGGGRGEEGAGLPVHLIDARLASYGRYLGGGV